MPKPKIKKQLMPWISLFRIIGILILELLIYFILQAWGIWKVVTIPDKIFIGLAAIVIAVLLGRKYEALKRR